MKAEPGKTAPSEHDKREEAIELILASLTQFPDELEHIRHVVTQRRLSEIRVGILIIVAAILFGTFLLYYVGLSRDTGLLPTSVGDWIMVALIVMFFVTALKGATMLMNIERVTEVYVDAVARIGKAS